MKRRDLEHIIGAAATIAEDDDIVVIGSRAVLGQFPDAPEELLISAEADVYPLNHPERADLVDGSIGELSPFHETFGYYAQGVGEETATLPVGWKGRSPSSATTAPCGPPKRPGGARATSAAGTGTSRDPRRLRSSRGRHQRGEQLGEALRGRPGLPLEDVPAALGATAQAWPTACGPALVHQDSRR